MPRKPEEVLTVNDYVTLKEFICTKIGNLEKLIAIQIQDLKDATIIAKREQETILSGMNESRDSLKDQNRLMVTKAEFTQFTNSVEADIRVLRESRAELAGKADQKQVNTAILIAVIGIVIGIIGIIGNLPR